MELEKLNRITSIILLGIIAYLSYLTLKWPFGVAILPRLFLFIMTACCILIFFKNYSSLFGKVKDIKKVGKLVFQDINISRLFLIVLLIVGYIYLMELLGFYSSTIIFLEISFIYLGERKLLTLLIIPLILITFIYLIFTLWLYVPLPEGILL